ncbi:Hypothetical predicted protein, partial [Pelobates cultripes]
MSWRKMPTVSVPEVTVLRTEVNRKTLYAPPMPTTTKRYMKREKKGRTILTNGDVEHRLKVGVLP